MKKRYFCLFTLLIFVFNTNTYATQQIQINKTNLTIESKYTKALFLKSEQKYNEAIEIFKQLLKNSTDKSRIYYQIADCNFKSLNFNETEYYARKAIDNNSLFVEPYILLFNLYNTLKENYKSADILNELLEHNPNLIKYNFILALLYINNIKNYNMAKYQFSNIIDFSQKQPISEYYIEQSHLALFKIHFHNKNYLEAISQLEIATKLNSKNSVKFFQLANFFASNNHLKENIKSLELFLEFHKDIYNNPKLLKKVYSSLGELYYITENPKASTYLYKSFGDKNYEEKLSYALFLEFLKRDNDSIKILNNILKREPSSIAANLAYAKISKRNNNLSEAYNYYIKSANLLLKTNLDSVCIWTYREADKLHNNDYNIYFNLAQLHEKKDQLSNSIYYFMKANQIKSDVELLIHIAYLYSMQNKYLQSNKYFTKAINKDISYSRIYFFQGLIAVRKEEYKKAEKLFNKAIKYKKDNHLYYFYLGLAQDKQKKIKESIKSLKKALNYDNNNASYLNYLGYLYVDNNMMINEAIKLIDQALQKDPFNGAYLDSLGWAYYRKGEFNKSLTLLLRAERNLKAVNSQDPIVYDHIGDVYKKLNKPRKAITYWKHSLNYKKSKSIEKKIKAIKLN